MSKENEVSRRTFCRFLVGGSLAAGAGVAGIFLDPDVSPVGKYVQMDKQLREKYPNVDQRSVPSFGAGGGGLNVVIVRGASSPAEKQEIREAYFADAEKISKALDDADAKRDPGRARRGLLKGVIYTALTLTGVVALVSLLDELPEEEKG